jgi:hypothetical protein
MSDATDTSLADDPPTTAASNVTPRSVLQRVWHLLHFLQVRLRFVFIFLIVFLIVGKWETITHYWQHWVGHLGLPAAEQAVSGSTEYFCPMCPGVLSAWPSQCPVCSMPLVRRTKGDMGILPDGALVRMQISPYRLQLGGIATSRVEYQELKSNDGSPVASVEPFASQPRNPPELSESEPRTAFVCPDHPQQVSAAAGCCPLDGKQLVPQPLAANERLRWQCPLHPSVMSDTAGATCPQCADLPLPPAVIAYAPEGMVLAIPQTAVVESAGLKVVFQQTSPGVFDAFPVELGEPSAGHYPVIAGLKRGSEIVSQGAFLLDAETRLDPDLAAAYFGADVRSRQSADPSGLSTHGKNSPAEIARLLDLLKLSDQERALALRQRVCPVTNLPLGSMGAPVAALGAGQPVRLCCEGCRGKFEKLHAKAK